MSMSLLLSEPAPSEDGRLAYTMREAAQALGISYHTVIRLIARGQLRACRAVPRRPLIPRTELLRMLSRV
jgi:excisionase family DNA binding protein